MTVPIAPWILRLDDGGTCAGATKSSGAALNTCAADAPPLTFALTTCGRPDACARLLARLLASAGEDDQVVVVDDAKEPARNPSTPRASTAVRDRPLLLSSGGRGAGAARNCAMRVARHHWIVFLDDDVLPGPGFAETVRAEVASGAFDVLTCNVLSEAGPLGELFDARYPLSRGDGVRTYRSGTGTVWSPNDVWRVGVGACMVWRADLLRALGGFPEPLGQGRPFGGAEDMAAFRNALLKRATIRYDGRLRVRHRSPLSTTELAAKMRGYALAEGAFAAHVWRSERRIGMATHLAWDIAGAPRRTAAELVRWIGGQPHLPLRAVAAFPAHAVRGFLGYLHQAAA